jgi:Uma2 family endonuclease
MAARIEPVLTIADIDAMPEDGNHYEIIEGQLFVSRAPSLTHQQIVFRLMFALGEHLRENPTGMIWPGPGVIFSNFSGVIPDVIYISNQRINQIASGDRVEGAPDLIIEVLSPGAENERRDRQAKRQLYAKYGVKEYWIVDPNKITVQIYRSTRLRLTATLTKKDDITSTLLPGFRCQVREIFR